MTVIIFIIVLAILILVHEFGHFIVAKKSGMKVEEFGLGFPPKLFSWKPKNSETTYSINLIPFGGFVKILGENGDEEISPEEKEKSFGSKGALKRAGVLAAGVFFNFLLAWLLIAIGLSIGTLASPEEVSDKYISDVNLTITGVLPDSPAQEAGLKPGDIILSVNKDGEITEDIDAENLSSLINKTGSEIELSIGRSGEEMIVAITPEEGIVDEGYAIGISMGEIGLAKLPFYLSIFEAFKISVTFLWVIFISLVGFVFSAIQGSAGLDQVTGPVGIAGMVGDAARLGFSALIYFTAVISLHLAVINLLPFPALDGGRLLFIAIEKIKGSKINQKIELWMNVVGFIILILLMVVVTWNDIVRLF